MVVEQNAAGLPLSHCVPQHLRRSLFLMVEHLKKVRILPKAVGLPETQSAVSVAATHSTAQIAMKCSSAESRLPASVLHRPSLLAFDGFPVADAG
jgi:hypothetical protein